ncbi:MAG: precorrin-2 dehydrogenase [Eubacteriales bacterium]|nr:precorrin-2 dehydrogenase [Eubacteriales bacterium]
MGFSYPVVLSLNEKDCLVVGGGQVALRKVKSLLQAGGLVTVVSPELHPELVALQRQVAIRCYPESYREEFLDEKPYFLAVAATNSREINRRVAEDCRKRRILVNVVDDPASCDFILPAVFQQGKVTVAVSTGGSSPVLARLVRDRIAGLLGPGLDAALSILSVYRQKGKNIADEKRRKELQEKIAQIVLTPENLELLTRGQQELIEERIKDVFGGGGAESQDGPS